MDMRIEAAGGQYLAFARDDLRARPDDDVHMRLDIGIAGLADRADLSIADGDVGLHDAPVIENDGVGDDRVCGPLRARNLGLAHAVANHFAAAEFHFLAIGREIALDLDEQVGVGKANPVAGRGAKHVGIGGARERGFLGVAHRSFLTPCPSRPGGNRTLRACPRSPPVALRDSGRARSARPCRRECRGACPSCGRVRI